MSLMPTVLLLSKNNNEYTSFLWSKTLLFLSFIDRFFYRMYYCWLIDDGRAVRLSPIKEVCRWQSTLNSSLSNSILPVHFINILLINSLFSLSLLKGRDNPSYLTTLIKFFWNILNWNTSVTNDIPKVSVLFL